MVNFECDLFLSTSSFYFFTIGPPRLITVGKNIIIFTACSENVSLVAERNLRARNPILRQQARSLQALLNQRREAGNDIFTFICSFMNNSLRCRVDNGFAPAVINGSYCTPNGGCRRKCDPFHGEFSSDDQSVTIEAINCDGQSATVTATRGRSG
ncbi:hypothetical protein GBAR_LOCUS4538 [Geodia barretti]|uniref:Uncharacterized protein n=1 Tax=Geodia barretti TaxID=519541 RepID=A0AA35R731_GEOBA|nr:hypothetical protein GBAR_LOCUS4538 [Geodia barretti]